MATASELTDARRRLVSKVPDELWLEIFLFFVPEDYFQTEHEYPYAPRTNGTPLQYDHTVSYSHFPDDGDRERLREAMAMVRSLTLVNKRWYRIAVEVLYSVVFIDSEKTASLFRRSLDETHGNPKLGAYVYHLLVDDARNPRTARHLNSVLHLMPSITIASLYNQVYIVFPRSNPPRLECDLGSQVHYETLHILSQVCGSSLRKLYLEVRSPALNQLAEKTLSDALSNMTNLRSLVLDTNILPRILSLPSSAKHLSHFRFSDDILFNPIALPECDPPFPSLTHMHLPLFQVDQGTIVGNKLLERQGPHCSALTIDCPSPDDDGTLPFSLATLFSYFPHVEQLNYIIPWGCPVYLDNLPPRTTHLVVTVSEASTRFEAEDEDADLAEALDFIAALKSLASTSGRTTRLERVTVVDRSLVSWLQENAAVAAASEPLIAEYGSVRFEDAKGDPLEILRADS